MNAECNEGLQINHSCDQHSKHKMEVSQWASVCPSLVVTHFLPLEVITT